MKPRGSILLIIFLLSIIAVNMSALAQIPELIEDDDCTGKKRDGEEKLNDHQDTAEQHTLPARW